MLLGSTSFPKPIPSTNQRFLEYALQPHFGAINMNNVVVGSHSLPAFHGLGFSQLVWAVRLFHLGRTSHSYR